MSGNAKLKTQNSKPEAQSAKRAVFSAAGACVAALLVGVCLVAFLALSACGNSGADNSVPELLIISPHGSDIRREFALAFSKWHEKKYGTAVQVRWPDIGGTGNVSRELEGDYGRGSSCGYDLAFGGGTATFEQFRQNGYLVKPPLPESVLGRVPQDIFGAPLHGPGDTWIAATMSNFGFDYNIDRLHELGLEKPRTWADLAGPKWFGCLSLADPSKSGSVRTCYDQVFLQYGWEKGWGVLMRMFANTSNLRDLGAAPADDVGSAQAVAGIAIDFFGRKEILRVGESLVAFVIPEGGTITDADPIAMLKGAPHPELAAQFIEFVISEEGQKLWTFRAGTPGGPDHYVLGRLSVLPEMYSKYGQYMLDPTNPFAAAQPLKGDEKASTARGAFLGDLIKSALIDNRASLIAARRAILDAGDPPDLLARLEAPPRFIPAHVSGGALVEEPERAMSAADQQVLCDEWAPSKKDSKEIAHDKSLLKERLKELWQKEFRERFGGLAAEAGSRHK